MPWIFVGILVILVIGLALKLMGDAAKFNEVRDDRDELKKEVRKLAEKTKDMQDKVAQKGAEAGDAKDHKKQVQEAEAAKRAAEGEKKKAAEEAAQVLERNRELSADLNRVRIEKEQQRQELVAARDRLRELGETAAQVQALKAEVARANDAVQAAQAAPVQVVAAPVAAPVESDPEREERQSSKLKRELEFARKAGDRLGTMLEQWKDKALESESFLRRTQKKLADTNSVLNITQSQLDLALDEIYILKNGEQPEHPLSDRAKHRAALKPKEPQVEVLKGEVVVLPGSAPKAKAEPDAAKAEVAPSDAAPASEAVVAAPVSAPIAIPEVAAKAPEAASASEPKTEPEAPPKAAAAKAKKEPEAPKAEAAKAEPAKSDSAKTDAKAPAKAEAKAEGAKTVLRKKDAEPEPAKKAPPRPAKTPAKK